jgi:hypothetical protein
LPQVLAEVPDNVVSAQKQRIEDELEARVGACDT